MSNIKRFGIDVSVWQKGFDFAKAKQEGVEFVIIKSSQKDYKDSQFENHYKNAKANGLGVGAYHFCTATTVEQAKAEAQTCINAIKGKQFEYPIYIDYENSNGIDYTKIDKKTNTSIIEAFCLALEKAGYWAGIYTNLDFYKNVVYGEELIKRFAFWIACWGSAKPIADAQMWQFGGETNAVRTNKVAGVVCDQNYCYVDYPALVKNNGKNGYAKATVETSKKIAGEITGINSARGTDALILITDSRKTTGFNKWGVDVIIDTSGKITSVISHKENTAIPSGCICLSGHGINADYLLNNCKVGEKIKIS